MDRKGAGLKLPVLINIQEMPPKLTFKFSPTSQTEQALLGNRHRVDVFISKKQNVNLKTLKLELDKLGANDAQEMRSVDINGNPGAADTSVDLLNTTSGTDAQALNSRRYTNVQNYTGAPRRFNTA